MLVKGQTSDKCLTLEELIDYYDRSFAEEDIRALRIEEHLAECNDCTEQAREIRRALSACDGWTAKSHGEAYWQSVMTKALEEASLKEKSWTDRLQRWREQGAALKESAVRVVMASAEKAGRIISEHLDAPKASAAVRTRGVAAGTVEASLPLAFSTFRVLGRAVAVRTRGAQKQRVEPKAHVKLEGGVIQVWVENFPPSRESILVMLIPLGGGEGTHSFVKKLERNEKGVLKAEFGRKEKLSGDYMVAFEPL